MKSRRAVLLVLMCASPLALAEIRFKDWSDPDAEPWKESSFALPAYPKDDKLIEMYVNETAGAKFFIDPASISVGGNDFVVRYTMVVKTGGGAVNVSYEGLRCDTSEVRIYAIGRADGSWVESATSEWRPLRAAHQKVLAREYFCPIKLPIYNADEGRAALKAGGHPRVKN